MHHQRQKRLVFFMGTCLFPRILYPVPKRPTIIDIRQVHSRQEKRHQKEIPCHFRNFFVRMIVKDFSDSLSLNRPLRSCFYSGRGIHLERIIFYKDVSHIIVVVFFLCSVKDNRESPHVGIDTIFT